MQKFQTDFIVEHSRRLGHAYSHLILRPADGTTDCLEHVEPGQFVQVAVNNADALLRRPISVHNVADGCLWLLVRSAGKATSMLAQSRPGTIINIILPLGHGFSIPGAGKRALLVGGGVGVAPLLLLGRRMADAGAHPEFLLGARSKDNILLADEFGKIGKVHITTDDGSCGLHGLVTSHPILDDDFDMISCCGPQPMMRAVATIARKRGIACEVSLENMMACGLGACLCCVEKNAAGHNVCVCTEGPVFNINDLNW